VDFRGTGERGIEEPGRLCAILTVASTAADAANNLAGRSECGDRVRPAGSTRSAAKPRMGEAAEQGLKTENTAGSARYAHDRSDSVEPIIHAEQMLGQMAQH